MMTDNLACRMEREPLRDFQKTETSQNTSAAKLTPENVCDQAAIVAAAKLLNSARKSQVKMKKSKLSLKKSASATVKKTTLRKLALSTVADFNETVEFRGSPSFRIAGKNLKNDPTSEGAPRETRNTVTVVSKSKDIQETDIFFPSTSRDHDGKSVCIGFERHNTACSTTNTKSGKQLQGCSVHCRNTRADNRCISSVTPQKLNLCESRKRTSSVSECDKSTSLSEENGRASSSGDTSLSSSFHTCPTCSAELRRGSFVRHIEMCLKHHPHDSGGLEGDELLLGGDTTLKESKVSTTVTNETEEMQTSEGDKILQADYLFCQLCQKDLSHLNSHRRTVHINKCIDQEEAAKQEEAEKERALEAARTQVLDCPMCGKVLRTDSSRKIHLKKCAVSVGVGPEQLLALVKKQQDDHLASVAAGVLPASYRPDRGLRQPKSAAPHTRRPAVPKSKLDEDTQLAIALSSSLNPQATAAVGSGSSDVGDGSSRRGRKQKQEEDCLLNKLTSLQAADRISVRVSDLITQEDQDGDSDSGVPALPPVSRANFLSKSLDQVHVSSDGRVLPRMMWQRTSLNDKTDCAQETANDAWLQFYVPALMPPIQVSKVAAGSKLRRMSEIPGRRRSLDGNQDTVHKQEGEETVIEESCESSQEDQPVPSTQTAALLAEMAAEGEELSQSQHDSTSGSLSVSQEQDIDLAATYSSLVNCRNYSDVRIKTAEGEVLFAHRIILSARCPSLLQMAEEGDGEVDLSVWSSECVLAVLQYVYSGLTDFDIHLLPAISAVAHRLSLTSLVETVINRRYSSEPACNVDRCKSRSGSADQTGQRKKCVVFDGAGVDGEDGSADESKDGASEEQNFNAESQVTAKNSIPHLCAQFSIGETLPPVLEKISENRDTAASARTLGDGGESLEHALQLSLPDTLERMDHCKEHPTTAEDMVCGTVQPPVLEKVTSGALQPAALDKMPREPVNSGMREKIGSEAVQPPRLEHMLHNKIHPNRPKKCNDGRVQPTELEKVLGGKVQSDVPEKNGSEAVQPPVLEKIGCDVVQSVIEDKTPQGGMRQNTSKTQPGISQKAGSNIVHPGMLERLSTDVAEVGGKMCSSSGTDVISVGSSFGSDQIVSTVQNPDASVSQRDVVSERGNTRDKQICSSPGVEVFNPSLCLNKKEQACRRATLKMISPDFEDDDDLMIEITSEVHQNDFSLHGSGHDVHDTVRNQELKVKSEAELCHSQTGVCSESPAKELPDTCREDDKIQLLGLAEEDEMDLTEHGSAQTKGAGGLVRTVPESRKLGSSEGNSEILCGSDLEDGNGFASDGDLFDDDIDLSQLPSTPAPSSGQQHSHLKKSRVDFVHTDTLSTFTEEQKSVDKESSKIRSDFPTPSCTHQQERKSYKRKSSETEDLRTDRHGQHLSQQSSPLPKRQRQMTSGLNSLSLSISAVDCSNQTSCLSSPLSRQFKTSTPQPSDGHLQKELTKNRHEVEAEKTGGPNVRHREVVPKASCRESVIASFGYTNRGVSSVEEKMSETTAAISKECGNFGSPVSVVEHDSLYVTPVVLQHRTRSTFQLVTPCVSDTAPRSLQQQVNSASPFLSSSCRTTQAETSLFRDKKQTSLYKTVQEKDVADGRIYASERQTKSGFCENAQSPRRQMSKTKESYSQDNQPSGVENSDSDIEIIDNSVLGADPPSPKFSSQLGSQSQPLCQTDSRRQSPAGLSLDEERLDAHTASPVAEDVWEGFEDMDAYNPDLLMDHDLHLDPDEKSAVECGTAETEGKKTPAKDTRHAAPAVTSPPGSFSTICLAGRIRQHTSSRDRTGTETPRSLSQYRPRTSCVADEKPGTLEACRDVVLLSSPQSSSPLKMPASLLTKTLSETPRSKNSSSRSVQGPGDSREGTLAAPPTIRSPPGGFIAEEVDDDVHASILRMAERAPGAEMLIPSGTEAAGPKTPFVVAKTPRELKQMPKTKRSQKAWVPPSPFTPIPAYDEMTTPDLKREVQKFGLKPVGKKRMKLVLKDIYHKTHQYETDSEYEDLGDDGLTGIRRMDEERPPKEKEKQKRKTKKQLPAGQKEASTAVTGKPAQARLKKTRRGLASPRVSHASQVTKVGAGSSAPSDSGTEQVMAKKTKRGLASGTKTPAELTRKELAPPQGQQQTKARESALPVTGHSENSDCCSSPEKGAVSSSQDSDCSERPDMTVYEEAGEEEDDDDTTPTQQTSLQDLRQKLKEFIHSRPALHIKVLTYEPLDLGVLRAEIKAAGVRCSQQKLLDFLDEMCITFTTKNDVPSKSRQGKRSRKGQKTKKSAASQQ